MGTCHGKAGIGVLTGNCQSTDFEKFEVAYFRDIHEIPYQELWENTKKKKSIIFDICIVKNVSFIQYLSKHTSVFQ